MAMLHPLLREMPHNKNIGLKRISPSYNHFEVECHVSQAGDEMMVLSIFLYYSLTPFRKDYDERVDIS
jgi:hypothetical protein